MRVDHFGVHWAPGGIPFLLQGSGAQNLISRDLQAPFEVRVRPRTLSCPHEIDLQLEAEAEWVSDPLAQAMMPLPGHRVFVLHDVERKWDRTLQHLQRLSSATTALMRPVWWRSPQDATPIYALTNITPIVFFGVTVNQVMDLNRNLDLARTFNRTILISTQTRLPLLGAQWIETNLGDVSQEPLEALGATALREYLIDPERVHPTAVG